MECFSCVLDTLPGALSSDLSLMMKSWAVLYGRGTKGVCPLLEPGRLSCGAGLWRPGTTPNDGSFLASSISSSMRRSASAAVELTIFPSVLATAFLWTPPEDLDSWTVCFDDEEEELVNDLDSEWAVCCLYEPLELLATSEEDLDLLTPALPWTAASDLDLVTLGLDWNSRGGGRGERGGENVEPLDCTTVENEI